MMLASSQFFPTLPPHHPSVVVLVFISRLQDGCSTSALTADSTQDGGGGWEWGWGEKTKDCDWQLRSSAFLSGKVKDFSLYLICHNWVGWPPLTIGQLGVQVTSFSTLSVEEGKEEV